MYLHGVYLSASSVLDLHHLHTVIIKSTYKQIKDSMYLENFFKAIIIRTTVYDHEWISFLDVNFYSVASRTTRVHVRILLCMCAL